MNPIFKNGTSPQRRLVLVLICSALLIYFDHSKNSFEKTRSYLQSFVSPLQYLANAPKEMFTWLGANFTSRQRLLNENEHYKAEQIIFSEQKMQLAILKQENDRLRALLASPLKPGRKKMVAEILSLDSDPYSHQIVINRGANNGVYEGQPVLDDQGVVGQILHVGATTSRVILITDITHGLPVRIKRNGIRMVAAGSGRIDRLIHNHVPHSTDVRIGDLLVTSGLGGKYPEGYPVAEVTFVKPDESKPFAIVLSKPIALIDRLRYLLLLWPDDETVNQSMTKSISKPTDSTINTEREAENVSE